MAKSGILKTSAKNFQDVAAKLKGTQEDITKAIKSTISDCKTRAPAQITKAVTSVYGIKSSEGTAAGKAAKKGAKTVGKIKVAGTTVDTIQLVYEGRRLTPIHFSMTPRTRPLGKKKYTVKATIFKGKKEELHGKSKYGTPVFLAPQKQGVVLPFQRMTKKRMPIEAFHTTSIPQMIENEKVAEDIQGRLDNLLAERLQHNVDRIADKRR